MQEFAGELGSVFPMPSAKIKDIGVTVGSHVGSGGVGVAFISKK